MKKMEFTCIVCPRGCQLNAEEIDGAIQVSGNSCARGKEYGVSELLNPVRNATFNMRIEGSSKKIVAVKTTQPMPVSSILEIAKKIKRVKLKAPLKEGDIVCEDTLGIRLMVTSDVSIG